MGSYRKLNPDNLASSKDAESPPSPTEVQTPSGFSKSFLTVTRKLSDPNKSLLNFKRKLTRDDVASSTYSKTSPPSPTENGTHSFTLKPKSHLNLRRIASEPNKRILNFKHKVHREDLAPSIEIQTPTKLDDVASKDAKTAPPSPTVKERKSSSGKSKTLRNLRRKSAEAKNLLTSKRKSVELSRNKSEEYREKLQKIYNEALARSNDTNNTCHDADHNFLEVGVCNECCLYHYHKRSDSEESWDSTELRRASSENIIYKNTIEPVRQVQDRNFLCVDDVLDSPHVSPHPAFRNRILTQPEDINDIINGTLENIEGPDEVINEENSSNGASDSTHWKMDPNNVVHKGGCHCGAVRFQVCAPASPTVIDCNCSICVKKQNRHFIVPEVQFKLLKGHDSLTTYTFNTHKAKHIFCSKCGVQSFYIPRSNSDGYGIAVHCLDEGTLKKEKIEKFDGKNWEQEIKKKTHVQNFSKATVS